MLSVSCSLTRAGGNIRKECGYCTCGPSHQLYTVNSHQPPSSYPSISLSLSRSRLLFKYWKSCFVPRGSNFPLSVNKTMTLTSLHLQSLLNRAEGQSRPPTTNLVSPPWHIMKDGDILMERIFVINKSILLILKRPLRHPLLPPFLPVKFLFDYRKLYCFLSFCLNMVIFQKISWYGCKFSSKNPTS